MNILMPQLGETVSEGKITKWFKAAGDAVKPGDNLFEIETDKVSMEVPATSAGVLSEIRVGVGEVAPVGAIVAVIAGEGEQATVPEIPRREASPFVAAKAATQQSASLGPRFRGDERPGTQAQAIPIKLDPFFEVRTPDRNYG